MNKSSITIVGAGSYGTALAIRLAKNGRNVLLWGRNSKKMSELKKKKCNKKFLPDIFFPKNLFIETSLKKSIQSSEKILIAVPSTAFSKILKKIKPYLQKQSKIIWTTKGLEKKTGRFLKEVATEILGNKISLSIIYGPTFAKEIALGLPAAAVISSSNCQVNKEIKNFFHFHKNFRIYINQDMIGVQLGVVIKNIIAIASGISDGLGFGINSRAALITRGFSEMMKLGISMGASPFTFTGMSGLGDLILTCTSNQSRNKKFGILIGKGETIKNAKKKINQTIEGLYNIKEIRILAKKFKVNMPITEEVYQIIYNNKKISDSLKTLLNNKTKNEIDPIFFKKKFSKKQ